MGGHILEISVMLIVAAILGFFIGWLFRKEKISQLQSYIAALEDQNNRLQADFNQNERLLIDCQTEKRKVEFEKQQIEKLLIDCEGKLTLSAIELAEKKNIQKTKKDNSEKKTGKNKKSVSSPKAKQKKKTNKETDNLTKIKGIGPKIASVLKKAKIESFIKLSKAKAEKISELLVKVGGNTYNRFDPATWPEQAKLAAEEKWEELKNLQNEL